jgi:predicted ATPase
MVRMVERRYGSLMARRRDVRRFGPGPYVLGFLRDEGSWGEGFPFDVPAIAAVETLRINSPVTLLAGDNGTGKSTLTEAIAEAMGFAAEGGELERLGERPAVPRGVLGGALEPVLSSSKPRTGYFLRAESFFNVAEFVDRGGTFSPDLSLYGDVPLHEQSHGESFLALAANRFGGDGLYILDEPEAALSVSGSLALVAIVARAARAGAQFIIATHSPILLACPRADIYELTPGGMTPCAYDDLDTVRLTRGFLDAPERYLRAALDELEAG